MLRFDMNGLGWWVGFERFDWVGGRGLFGLRGWGFMGVKGLGHLMDYWVSRVLGRGIKSLV